MNRAPAVAADWPAPAGVHAFTTLRHGAGYSAAPFDTFNLFYRDDRAAQLEALRRMVEAGQRLDPVEESLP